MVAALAASVGRGRWVLVRTRSTSTATDIRLLHDHPTWDSSACDRLHYGSHCPTPCF